jgi:hypothetical protein
MPTISVDKAALFEALGREYVEYPEMHTVYGKYFVDDFFTQIHDRAI